MDDPRAVIFPRILIIIMGILAGLLLLQDLIIRKKMVSEKGKRFPFGPFFLCFVMVLIYFSIMESLGFYLSSFLFFVAVTFILGAKGLTVGKSVARIGVSFFFMAILYVLFNRILAVQTPKGLFF
jgi:hypothetical protein